jgi:histidyl-tRNA synthetase
LAPKLLSPLLDTEIIVLAYEIIVSLGLQNVSIKINSLGVPESRDNYKNILRKYLQSKLTKLSEDSRKRFNTNILRIFDSKEEVDQEIMNEAPLLIDYLDKESLDHFEEVKRLLQVSGISFSIDAKLVRGLDYYTKTTFEIISNSIGAQSALCGGGRYDLLTEQLGGKYTPGVGFAAGIERILLACENEKALVVPDDDLSIYIVRMEDELSQEVFNLSLYFRKDNIPVEIDYLQRSVKAQMREANKLNAKYVLLVGGEEYSSGKLILKNMKSSIQELVSKDQLQQIVSKVKDI